MRTRILAGSVVAAAGITATALPGSAPGAPLANASAGVAEAPAMALLAGIPGATQTHLVVARPGAAPRIVDTIEHAPDSVVRGIVLGGSNVLVVADLASARERSWAAGLLRLRPGQPPALLADRVLTRSRPLAVDSRRVLIERGVAGPTAAPGHGPLPMREDALTIDEVDIETGAARTIYSGSGYKAHLGGMYEQEAIVYRVGPAGADLVGVNVTSGATRTIVAQWPAMARDFSIDRQRRALVVQQYAETAGSITVETVDLNSGVRQVLATSHSADLVPHAWPGGSIHLHPEGADGPRLLGGAAPPQLPAGPGVVWVRARSGDEGWVGALRMAPRGLPAAWAIRVRDGKAVGVPAPEGMRADIAGFLTGEP